MKKQTIDPEARDLKIVELCLDFANTAAWHASDQPEEHLNDYTDVVAWAKSVRLVTAHEAHRLNEEATRRPNQAVTTLNRAIALREAIYHVFSAQAHGRVPAQADLDILNKERSRALAKSQIVAMVSGFEWEWMSDETALDSIMTSAVPNVSEGENNDFFEQNGVSVGGNRPAGRCNSAPSADTRLARQSTHP